MPAVLTPPKSRPRKRGQRSGMAMRGRPVGRERSEVEEKDRHHYALCGQQVGAANHQATDNEEIGSI
jgi:hypothetical protein